MLTRPGLRLRVRKAVRIAKEQKSASLEKRAEATYCGISSLKSECVRKARDPTTTLVTASSASPYREPFPATERCLRFASSDDLYEPDSVTGEMG